MILSSLRDRHSLSSYAPFLQQQDFPLPSNSLVKCDARDSEKAGRLCHLAPRYRPGGGDVTRFEVASCFGEWLESAYEVLRNRRRSARRGWHVDRLTTAVFRRLQMCAGEVWPSAASATARAISFMQLAHAARPLETH